MSQETATAFDFRAHLERQREFSSRTFGPGMRTAGVVDHIRKELCEIERAPTDLTEWIDVVILALDGAWRCGATPEQIIAALVAKQTKNEGRAWPDWRTMPADKAIEHDRAGDAISPRGAAEDSARMDAIESMAAEGMLKIRTRPKTGTSLEFGDDPYTSVFLNFTSVRHVIDSARAKR